MPRLLVDCDRAAAAVRALREAREVAGVSLDELEQRTGIRKLVLSLLENSKAPNPTWATLDQYARAIGKRFTFTLEKDCSNSE